MDIVLIAAVAASNILCFVVGVRVGQKVSWGEKVRLPEIHPLQTVRTRLEQQETDREQRRVETILRNIERYDGTGAGQEDVPERG